MNPLSTRKMTVEPLSLCEGITAFSTLRNCTDRYNPYDGFNACSYTGDTPEHVAGCRAELPWPSVMPRQTHSLDVFVADTPGEPYGVDAVVSSRAGLALCVNTADCVPVVMADPVAKVIAAVHSGWKGTVGHIAALALREMQRLGAEPSRVLAAMGPCICADCFEVGEEVASAFREAGLGNAVIDRRPRPHVDLPEAVAITLAGCGVSRERITMPCGCSRCEPEKWFSARRLGVESGRTLTVICVR